jgi:hypothetical protein
MVVAVEKRPEFPTRHRWIPLDEGYRFISGGIQYMTINNFLTKFEDDISNADHIRFKCHNPHVMA